MTHNCQDVAGKRKSKPEVTQAVTLAVGYRKLSLCQFCFTNSVLQISTHVFQYPQRNKGILGVYGNLINTYYNFQFNTKRLASFQSQSLLNGWMEKLRLKCFVFGNILSLKDSTLHVGKHLSVHVTIVPSSSFFFFFLLRHRLSLCPKVDLKTAVISWPNPSQAAIVGMSNQTRLWYWLLDPRNWTF